MATLNYKILPARRKSSGKLGIYISLTFKKEVRYISTEFEIDDEFQFENGKVCYRKDATIMNKRMEFVLQGFREKLASLNLSRFSNCAQLKDMLLKKDMEENESTITIKEMFEKRIIRLVAEGRKSYADMNRYTCNVILDILHDIPVAYLSRSDIKILYSGMQKRKFANGNIQMRMTHFKAAINELIDDRVVIFEEHPFKGFRMPQSEIRMMDITLNDFCAIRKLKSDEKQISFARDMFLLSFYLGGINLVDLVKADFSGEMMVYIRQKSVLHRVGEKKIALTIQPEAREIVNRYVADNGRLNLGESSYENMRRHLNKCFKLLAAKVGITSIFSYYSARKTFAQFAFELGIRTEVIEYCIGQSMKSNRPVYNYVRVMQRYADEAIRSVIDYTINQDKEYAAGCMQQFPTKFSTM